MKLKKLLKSTKVVCSFYLFINQECVFKVLTGSVESCKDEEQEFYKDKEQALHDYGNYYVKEIFPAHYKGSGCAIGIEISKTKEMEKEKE